MNVQISRSRSLKTSPLGVGGVAGGPRPLPRIQSRLQRASAPETRLERIGFLDRWRARKEHHLPLRFPLDQDIRIEWAEMFEPAHREAIRGLITSYNHLWGHLDGVLTQMQFAPLAFVASVAMRTGGAVFVPDASQLLTNDQRLQYALHALRMGSLTEEEFHQAFTVGVRTPQLIRDFLRGKGTIGSLEQACADVNAAKALLERPLSAR